MAELPAAKINVADFDRNARIPSSRIQPQIDVQATISVISLAKT